MASRLGVFRAERRSARALAAHSRAALDRPLDVPAELWIAVAEDPGRLLGAFQRGAGMPDFPTLARRGSGGPDVLVGEGTVHVALALAHPAALVPCDERRIVNRYVRPLLRALTKSMQGSALASFFGRDWVAVANRPAAWVGFGHDATTRRTLFEAFVAVRSPFADRERASFRGRPPTTLESIAGAPLDPLAVAGTIADAYAGDAERVPIEAPALAEDGIDVQAEPPWAATCDEAIGVLGAGPDARGVFRVGGDLLVSRDALAQLEARAAAAPQSDLGRVVDETLAAPGVALEGVRSLSSLRDVIARARAG